MSGEVSVHVFISGSAYRRIREFADERRVSVPEVAGLLIERATAPHTKTPENAATAAVAIGVEERRDLMIRQGIEPRVIAAALGMNASKIYNRRSYLRKKDRS